MFPVTFKLLLTCKSFPIVTFPPINGFGANEITGVELSPVPPVTVISFAVPEMILHNHQKYQFQDSTLFG
jgi:hypothetical protein